MHYKKEWLHYTDGTLIQLGDYVEYEGALRKITKISIYDNSAKFYLDCSPFRYLVSDNEHQIERCKKDSLERIVDDAEKLYTDYWECNEYRDARCTAEKCPVLVDGKMPKERYNCSSCNTAKILDLLYRQRLLLEEERR